MLRRARLLLAHRQRLPIDVYLADNRRARQVGQGSAEVWRARSGERQPQVPGDMILGRNELEEVLL